MMVFIMSLRLNGTTIGAIENVVMTNVPMAALIPQYRLALSHKVSYVDSSGNSYVNNKVLVQWLLGAECKRIDKEIYDKQFAAMQNRSNDNGDGSVDHKGRV